MYIIPFICSILNRQIHRNKKYLRGEGAGVEYVIVTVMKMLEGYYSDGCATLRIILKPLNCILCTLWVGCMVCELHFNKAVINKGKMKG